MNVQVFEGFQEDLAAASEEQLNAADAAQPGIVIVPEPGYVRGGTRAAGILALLLSAYDMTWPEIYAWIHANIDNGPTEDRSLNDDWIPTLSPADTALVANNGIVYELAQYPMMSGADFNERWNLWKSGQLDVALPPHPVEPAAQAQITAAVAATPVTVAPAAPPHIQPAPVAPAVVATTPTPSPAPQQPGLVPPTQPAAPAQAPAAASNDSFWPTIPGQTPAGTSDGKPPEPAMVIGGGLLLLKLIGFL